MPADLNDYFKKKKNGRGSGSGGGGNKPEFNLPEPPEFLKNLNKKAGIVYAIVIFVFILIIVKPFMIINSGEVGIKVTTGDYHDEPKYAGLHFYIPFIQHIFTVDTRERVINYLSKEDAVVNDLGSGIKRADAITALDKRGLVISIDITVQYKLNPETAPQTIKDYGLEWEQKIINPIVRGVVRNVIGNYNAEDLPKERARISQEISAGIAKKVDAITAKPVSLSTVNLREIILPQKIKDQIEKVQIANQEVDRAKLDVAKAKQVAAKNAALAQGKADANRIQAQGRADAMHIEAKAEAERNQLVAKSIDANILKYKHLDVQGKFNEALRVNRDAKIFLTPGGSTPNIWVDSKSSTKTNTVMSDGQ